MNFLPSFYKRRLLKRYEQTDNVAKIIMLSTANRLLEKYKNNYDEDFVPLLVAAIVNRLFYKEPSEDFSRKFSNENKELIYSELSKIKDEPDICYMVSMVAHLKSIIAGNSLDFKEVVHRWISELKGLNIFMPIEKIKMPNSIDEFIEIARSFQ